MERNIKMKIQFIITGWHMNQKSLIEGLSELESENESVNVFPSTPYLNQIAYP